MSSRNEATVSENQSTEPAWSDEPWIRVKTAIIERWPHLDSRDVEALPQDVYELEKFLNEFTNTSADEVQAVVREHAPAPSILKRASHMGEQLSDRVAPPVQTAMDRVRYEMDEHRGATSGLVFIAGLALGALGYAAYIRSREPSSTIMSYLPDRLRR
ncbi:hypothetical protein N9N28_01690 [Rubripirellula amarantea]|nr:hypothetical protein [Rubripirellula amarantea]